MTSPNDDILYTKDWKKGKQYFKKPKQTNKLEANKIQL